MSKNFDAERLATVERDRSFQIGGLQFTYRVGVKPEVIARYFDGGETNLSTVAIYDETIKAFLEPGQEERWDSVRAVEGADAITLADIRTLIEWLIGEQASRPTGQQSGSGNGAATRPTGTPSTDVSASEVAVTA